MESLMGRDDDKPGVVVEGCYCIRALNKALVLVNRNGAWDGEKVLPKSAILHGEDMQSGQTRALTIAGWLAEKEGIAGAAAASTGPERETGATKTAQRLAGLEQAVDGFKYELGRTHAAMDRAAKALVHIAEQLGIAGEVQRMLAEPVVEDDAAAATPEAAPAPKPPPKPSPEYMTDAEKPKRAEAKPRRAPPKPDEKVAPAAEKPGDAALEAPATSW